MPTVTRGALGALAPQAAAAAVIDALARGDRPEAKRIIGARPKATYALPGGGLYPWLDASDTWGETVGLLALRAWYRLERADAALASFTLTEDVFDAADRLARDAAEAGAAAGWAAAGGAPHAPGAWAVLSDAGAAEATGPLGAYGDALTAALLPLVAVIKARDILKSSAVAADLEAAAHAARQSAAALASGADRAARDLWGAEALTVIRSWQAGTFDPEAGALWAAVAGVDLEAAAAAEAEAIAGALCDLTLRLVGRAP